MDCLQTVNELNTIVISYPDTKEPPEELPQDGKNGEGFYACMKEITVSSIKVSDLSNITEPRENSLVVDTAGNVYRINEVNGDTLLLSARLFKLSQGNGGGGGGTEPGEIAIITNEDIDKVAV